MNSSSTQKKSLTYFAIVVAAFIILLPKVAIAQDTNFLDSLDVKGPLQSGLEAYQRGDFRAALDTFTGILDADAPGIRPERNIAALYLLKSLEDLERTMDIAERISLVFIGQLPAALRPEAQRLQVRADLIRGRFRAARSKAKELLEQASKPPGGARILHYQAEADRRLIQEKEALNAYAESIFFSGVGNEFEMRTSLEGIIAILRDMGRLAEAETINRIRFAMCSHMNDTPVRTTKHTTSQGIVSREYRTNR
jgi:hypothetical protein